MAETAQEDRIRLPHQDLLPLTGEALQLIGEQAVDHRADVFAKVKITYGMLDGRYQHTIVCAGMSPQSNQITHSLTELDTAYPVSGWRVRSAASVYDYTAKQTTKATLRQEGDTIQMVTQTEEAGHEPIPGEVREVTPTAIIDMIRSSLGSADDLPQPRPTWAPRDGSITNGELWMVPSERMVPLYARLLGMIGKAIAHLNPVDQHAFSADIQVDFGAAARIYGVIQKQKIEVSAFSWDRQVAKTFSLGLEFADVIRGTEYCFMRECSVTTDDRSGDDVVLSKDTLIGRREGIGVLHRERTPATEPVTTEIVPVNGHEQIVEMLSSVLRLATGEPDPTPAGR